MRSVSEERLWASKRVVRDRVLGYGERATSLQIADDVRAFSVTTEIKSHVNRLILHPGFEVAQYRTVGDGLVPPESLYRERGSRSGVSIVGVRGSMPIGYVSIGARPRASRRVREVVSGRVLEAARKEANDE